MSSTTDRQSSHREGLASFWRAVHDKWAFVSLATLLYWFAAHTLRPLVTLRLDELGASDAQIALTVAAYPFFSLFFAIPGGRLVDRIGIIKVLTGSLVGMILIGIGYVVADSPLEILLRGASAPGLDPLWRRHWKHDALDEVSHVRHLAPGGTTTAPVTSATRGCYELASSCLAASLASGMA